MSFAVSVSDASVYLDEGIQGMPKQVAGQVIVVAFTSDEGLVQTFSDMGKLDGLQNSLRRRHIDKMIIRIRLPELHRLSELLQVRQAGWPRER